MNSLSLLYKYLQQHQEIPFVEFMQLALYHPETGYYSAGLPKFGIEGDFITAPELTPLFAQTLANQCRQIIPLLPNPIIFEFGAGSGRLCVDILKRLEQLNCLPSAYYILEVSGFLQAEQSNLIKQEISHLAHLVTWFTQWPTEPFNGIVIANEVLDAMPVHRFLQTEENLLESFITVNEKDELVEIFKPTANLRLQDYLKSALPKLPLPYQSEVNLFVEGWLRQLANILNQGAIILIDYGYPRHEYYHPDRSQGTLMCHYKHQAHTNFLAHIGEQDITAHIDFTHVAEAACAADLHVAGYTNQAAFLLANDLLGLLAEIEDKRARINATQAVKKLTLPSEMGELFKVMALTKNLDVFLTGFQLQDKRASL
ncbi:class I SAM-dependent methyltransferase [Legionella gresilensis]|uniref:class I SAM-dependent methyltransferase n=1 Tax=Legionella gresilensis TaxID=91823 RepID=UPI0010411A3C|nr:SAM-dependent methyltransferase [Legionella gresilensis]